MIRTFSFELGISLVSARTSCKEHVSSDVFSLTMGDLSTGHLAPEDSELSKPVSVDIKSLLIGRAAKSMSSDKCDKKLPKKLTT